MNNCRNIICILICLLLSCLCNSTMADGGYDDSAVFALNSNPRLSGKYSDSSSISIDSFRVNKTWADSDTFLLSEPLGIIKGINYTGWEPNALLTESSDESLRRANIVGCNWAAIVVWWFQNDINSSSIEPDYTKYSARCESVVHAIQTCHGLGMNVMLKPQIDLRNDPNHWRGDIVPSAEWFNSYKNFINYWADVAEDCHIKLFCVGTELQNTTSDSNWIDIIQNVRSRYQGSLTYAANHGNEENIDWWDNLDFIGIDAYYALSDMYDPPLEGLKAAWNNRLNTINGWRSYVWPSMDIIFTEVGYKSLNGTNITPWNRDPTTNPLDLDEQAECYEALLEMGKDRNWLSGVFWWNWETDPDAGGESDSDFTPQNKPAQKVLCKYYFKSDLNGDCKADFSDFAILANQWLQAPGDPSADIAPEPNGDNFVDSRDFALFAENWLNGVTP